jgi:hypothetical protein
MTNQEIMEAIVATDQDVLQDRLESFNAELRESQAATLAAHAAKRESDAQTVELANWTKEISHALLELKERSFAELRGMGRATAVEDLGVSVSRKQAAVELLTAEAQDRAETVRPALEIAVLTAEISEAYVMASVADQCRLVAAKKLYAALENVPEAEGAINVVTERQEQLERYAALCWEKHSLAIAALDREVRRQALNKEHRQGIITRRNVPNTF